MADVSYNWEKLHLATMALATSNSDLAARLLNALMSMHVLGDDDFENEGDLAKFQEIMSACTAVPGQNGGAFAASINAMTVERRAQIAELIVSLYDDCCEAYSHISQVRR